MLLATFIIGLLFIFAAARMMWRNKKLLREGEICKANVAGHEMEEKGSFTLYFPVMEFKTLSGKAIKKKYHVGISKPYYAEGDEVEVICKKNDPEDFVIKSSGSETFCWLLFFIGIALMLYACKIFFFRI